MVLVGKPEDRGDPFSTTRCNSAKNETAEQNDRTTCYPSRMRSDRFDPRERAREKQASRDSDARDLASGAKSREQLRRENGVFALPDAQIVWDECEQLS